MDGGKFTQRDGLRSAYNNFTKQLFRKIMDSDFKLVGKAWRKEEGIEKERVMTEILGDLWDDKEIIINHRRKNEPKSKKQYRNKMPYVHKPQKKTIELIETGIMGMFSKKRRYEALLQTAIHRREMDKMDKYNMEIEKIEKRIQSAKKSIVKIKKAEKMEEVMPPERTTAKRRNSANIAKRRSSLRDQELDETVIDDIIENVKNHANFEEFLEEVQEIGELVLSQELMDRIQERMKNEQKFTKKDESLFKKRMKSIKIVDEINNVLLSGILPKGEKLRKLMIKLLVNAKVVFSYGTN